MFSLEDLIRFSLDIARAGYTLDYYHTAPCEVVETTLPPPTPHPGTHTATCDDGTTTTYEEIPP